MPIVGQKTMCTRKIVIGWSQEPEKNWAVQSAHNYMTNRKKLRNDILIYWIKPNQKPIRKWSSSNSYHQDFSWKRIWEKWKATIGASLPTRRLTFEPAVVPQDCVSGSRCLPTLLWAIEKTLGQSVQRFASYGVFWRFTNSQGSMVSAPFANPQWISIKPSWRWLPFAPLSKSSM
jgi:hypothetical protein